MQTRTQLGKQAFYVQLRFFELLSSSDHLLVSQPSSRFEGNFEFTEHGSKILR